MGDAPQLWPSFPAAGVAVLSEVLIEKEKLFRRL